MKGIEKDWGRGRLDIGESLDGCLGIERDGIW